ncbi:Colicin V production protein [Desulforamulus putei DSM 12395]|uniref:Colicin V production protein n=1 Tax=Desulforamulus putei DSM 12395 TaxID=1121429 RepID=A0A1M5BNT3_9FIRM|nr:Colicin V production protein [Desulforamulus putei DSM 12395]
MLAGVLRLAGLLLSFGAAVHYHLKLAQWLADRWGWADSIAQFLKPLIKLPEPFNSPEILKLPVGLLQKISAQLPLPTPWQDIIAHLSLLGPHHTVGQALNLLLAHGLLKILAFLGIFLVVKTAVEWIVSIFAVIFRFSPLGPVDKLAGLVLGFFTGVVIILVMITVLVPLQVPLALLGVQGLSAALAKGISTSFFMAHFGPPLQHLDILPPLIPEFSSQFLFKHIPGGPGTKI